MFGCKRASHFHPLPYCKKIQGIQRNPSTRQDMLCDLMWSETTILLNVCLNLCYAKDTDIHQFNVDMPLSSHLRWSKCVPWSDKSTFQVILGKNGHQLPKRTIHQRTIDHSIEMHQCKLHGRQCQASICMCYNKVVSRHCTIEGMCLPAVQICVLLKIYGPSWKGESGNNVYDTGLSYFSRDCRIHNEPTWIPCWSVLV